MAHQHPLTWIQLLLYCSLHALSDMSVSVLIEPWCNDSIRVRMRPSMDSAHSAPILDDLPGALLNGCLPQHQRMVLSGNFVGDTLYLDAASGNVTSGNLQVAISQGLGLTFTRMSDGAKLATSLQPSFSASSSPYFSVGVAIHPGQAGSKIYGLGQLENTSAKGGCDGNGHTARALPLCRNGQAVDLDSYKFHVSIPFAYSTSGFGMLFNHPGSGKVVVSENGSLQWNATTALQLDWWLTASSPSTTHESIQGDVYRHYADAVGHPPVLPQHAAQFWQCRLRYRNQSIVEQVAAGYAARNISLGMLVVDFMNQHQDGDFHMNPACFPNITGMTRHVHTLTGAHMMVSFWPDVRPGADAYKALHAAGCVNNGKVDPTAKHCRDFIWSEYVKPNYVDHGVTDFWLDEDDGSSMSPLNGTGKRPPDSFAGRIWANQWMQTFADGLRDEGKQGVILTRGFWPGAAKLGVVLWSSDIWSTFEELEAQVPEGVAASLSGVPWWATDVGGFGCPYSPHADDSPYMRELIVRWYQFGALSPIFRTHGCRAGAAEVLPEDSPCQNAVGMKPQGPQGSCGYNEVWSYGTATEPILTRFIQLRNDYLLPYVLELAANVSREGVPTMRPLWWEFPDDSTAWDASCEDQYMFGPAFLVAPVTRQGARERMVYFPGGSDVQWAEVPEAGGELGKTYAGGQHVIVPAPLEKLPLFRRISAVVFV